MSDADEKQLQDTLRTAIDEEPTTRILAARGPRFGHHAVDAIAVAGATPSPERNAATLLRRGCRRTPHARLADNPWRTTGYRYGRGVAGAVQSVGIRSRRRAGTPTTVGRTGRFVRGRTADQWSRLIDHVVAAPAGEDQIALRDQAVYVPRLTRRAGQPTATPPELRSDATYLVTGGLGAIGLEVAEYLAAHGARHLVLTSRRAPSDAAQQRIDAIREQSGCDVRAITADVANPHDVARVLTTVRAELPPLAGIVHAAGEISTTPLQALDDAEVNRVFAGKVWGAWNLSEATAD